MLWKNKSNSQVIAHLYPGIYQFELPFFNANLVPNEEGIVKVEKCDIEVHVGKTHEDLVVVLISDKEDNISVTNFIESVANVILKEYLPDIIITPNLFDQVKWVHRQSYPRWTYNKLTFEYSDGRLISPRWSSIDNHWIIDANKLPK